MMPPNVHSNNGDLENSLESLPEEVASALVAWRTASLEREKFEALIYLREKGQDQKKTAEEIKAIVRADESRYAYVLAEIKSEGRYNFLYEKLMSVKRLAGLRTAF